DQAGEGLETRVAGHRRLPRAPGDREAGGGGGGGFTARSRGSVKCSTAYRTPSRPIPESFVPPYGMLSTRKDGASFKITPPTSSSSKAASASPRSRVKTPAWSP